MVAIWIYSSFLLLVSSPTRILKVSRLRFCMRDLLRVCPSPIWCRSLVWCSIALVRDWIGLFIMKNCTVDYCSIRTVWSLCSFPGSTNAYHRISSTTCMREGLLDHGVTLFLLIFVLLAWHILYYKWKSPNPIILTLDVVVHYHHYKYLKVFLYLPGSFYGFLLGLSVNCSGKDIFFCFSNGLSPLSGVRFLCSRAFL